MCLNSRPSLKIKRKRKTKDVAQCFSLVLFPLLGSGAAAAYHLQEYGTFPIQFDSQVVTPQNKVLFPQMSVVLMQKARFLFTEVLQICFVFTDKSVTALIIIGSKTYSIVRT